MYVCYTIALYEMKYDTIQYRSIFLFHVLKIIESYLPNLYMRKVYEIRIH